MLALLTKCTTLQSDPQGIHIRFVVKSEFNQACFEGIFFINGMFFNAETYEGDYIKLIGMELFPSTNKQNNWILVKIVVNE